MASIKNTRKKPRASKGPKDALPAITDDPEEEEKEPPKKGKKGKKTASIAVGTETKSSGCQTDLRYAPTEMFQYVESEYFCKIITRLYTEENDKLRKERDEYKSQITALQQRTESAESDLQQAQYQIKQQNVELDPLREQKEMLEVENEELSVKLEIANIEIEELNEKLEEQLDQYVEQIATDQKEHAEIVALNQQLQQQLAEIVRIGQDLIDSKDKHINSLATESNYVEQLSLRLKDLLSVEQEVLGLKSKVKELEDRCEQLQDADTMCRTLVDDNNRLEAELADWREWVLDVEAERKVLEELHQNDDAHIEDLTKEKKDMQQQLLDLTKSNKTLKIEKEDLQKEIFQMRNKMERQDISAANDFGKYNFAPTTSAASTAGGGISDNNTMGSGNPTDDDYEMVSNPADNVIANGGGNNQQSKPILDNSDGRKLEALWNENLKLQTQVEDMRSIVMEQINESIQGQAHYVEYELMKQYLPKDSQDVDYRGISVLALIQKILYKAKACRGLLERFYNDPSSATLKNPALATMSHGLCPRILAIENYMRAIQEGFLSIETDKDDEWKNKISRFNSSGSHRILESFDDLLTVIEKAPNTNELNFDIDTLEKHKKLLKDFIEKQFAAFSPERQKKDEYRCSKNIVLQNMSETHYRFQSLSLQLNQFNAKLFDLVYAPGNTASSSAVPIEDDNKYEENGLGSNDDDSLFKELKIGAVEKLFRLTNGIIADTAQILQYCQPVELGYSKLQYSKNLLKDANRTSIKWGQLTKSKYISGRAKERVSQMLEAIKQIRRFDSKKINEIIAKEEEFNERGEANEDGLINILEKAENIISEVRKIIGSTLYTTEKSTDNMQDTSYDDKEINEPYWETYSARFRLLFEQQRENEIKMKELEENIKQANEKVINAEKSQKQKEQTIVILTEQNTKEKDKSKALSETQKENIELRETKEKLSKKVLDQAKKVSEQEEEIANKSAAIEKYKKAIQRIKDKDNPLGSRDKPVHVRQETVPTGVSNGVPGPKGGGINIGRGGKYLINTSTEIEYSQLLQQTIQSLRRKVTELMMDKKLTNCKLNLKPLPFTLLRDKVISNLNAELSKKAEKKKKRVKKEKIIKEQKEKPSENGDEEDGKEESKDNRDGDTEENKEAEESEYEWVTDDEDNDDEVRAAKQAQLMKLQREKEMTEKMQNELDSLSTNLDDIRSKPMIIDLTKKSKRNNDLSQDIIGRQMKLRDVHLQCQQMKEDITRRVEEQNRENINDDYVQINNDRDSTENKSELGIPIATIEIPNSSLKSLGYDRTHKVRLPPQRFDRLQTSFLW